MKILNLRGREPRLRAIGLAATVAALWLLASCSLPPGTNTASDLDPPRCPRRHRPVETTLQQIMARKFTSARDKMGTCGTLVTVRNLRVLAVIPQEDGDWHVEVTDGRVPIFITEMIPRDQAREGRPRLGRRIDETGFAYDDMSADNVDHQYTRWEIHPIVAWTPSAPPPAPDDQSPPSTGPGRRPPGADQPR